MNKMRLGNLLNAEECKEIYGSEIPANLRVYRIEKDLTHDHESDFKNDLHDILKDSENTLFDISDSEHMPTSIAATLLGCCMFRSSCYMGIIADNFQTKLFDLMADSEFLSGKLCLYSSLEEARQNYMSISD